MTDASRGECRQIMSGISAYLDGDIDETACAAIERHCARCPTCAAVVAGLRETVGLCRTVAVMPLPDDVRRRAQESVRRLLQREDQDRTNGTEK